jgi:hypothetical protein
VLMQQQGQQQGQQQQQQGEWPWAARLAYRRWPSDRSYLPFVIATTKAHEEVSTQAQPIRKEDEQNKLTNKQPFFERTATQHYHQHARSGRGVTKANGGALVHQDDADRATPQQSQTHVTLTLIEFDHTHGVALVHKDGTDRATTHDTTPPTPPPAQVVRTADIDLEETVTNTHHVACVHQDGTDGATTQQHHTTNTTNITTAECTYHRR